MAVQIKDEHVHNKTLTNGRDAEQNVGFVLLQNFHQDLGVELGYRHELAALGQHVQHDDGHSVYVEHGEDDGHDVLVRT